MKEFCGFSCTLALDIFSYKFFSSFLVDGISVSVILKIFILIIVLKHPIKVWRMLFGVDNSFVKDVYHIN